VPDVRGPAKHLGKGVLIYGAGDAAIQIVNLLLLPVYVKYDILTTVDYGALALILSIETFAKVLTRWGLDGAFMRFYFDREDGEPRRRMTATIVWFMAIANGVLLTAGLAASSWLAARLGLQPGYLLALRIMLVNISLMAFTFIPLHAMRLRKQAAIYSAFTLARSAGTVALRVLLVIVLGFGITGIYVTDLLLTVVLLGAMWPWLKPLVGFTFSMHELKQALRFGLPRLPAGAASQALDSVPKIVLGRQFPQSEVGVYQNGTTLGSAVSFFKSAFETAWAPFYYETAREPDARLVFSKMATYGVAVLALLVAGTTAISREIILLVLRPEYLRAVPVVPIIALAMALQGVYQLTSIGLNLTNRTELYSVSTMTAAAVAVAAAVLLIPAFGVTGAAVAVLVAYLTQTIAALAFAQRLYPVPYETGRLMRIVIAAAGSALLARLLPPMSPLAGLLARGTTAAAAYVALLWASGFFRATERAFLREMLARLRQQRPAAPATSSIDA
jgi:O-antigen/teichoic acid export membrane protein